MFHALDQGWVADAGDEEVGRDEADATSLCFLPDPDMVGLWDRSTAQPSADGCVMPVSQDALESV